MAVKKKRIARDANAALRAARAVQLRTQGLTYEQIAAECGYSDRASAWNAVQGELSRIVAEPVDILRKLEMARLDEMLAAIWPKVTHKPEPLDGSEDEDERKAKRRGADLFAIDRAVAIMERRAKLMGLDMPTGAGALAGVVIVRQYGGLNPSEV